MDTENRISAVASSIATTDSRVDVTGPFALYWLITMIVAAGAVAAAIDPSTRENATSCPVTISTATTTTTANKDSSEAMISGAAPTFLK